MLEYRCLRVAVAATSSALASQRRAATASTLHADKLAEARQELDELGRRRDDLLNERHRHKLEQCRTDLDLLLNEFPAPGGNDAGCGAEVAGTMLSSILSQFGEISGRIFSEQLLEAVFSRFCVGK